MIASFTHDSASQSWLFTIYCRTYVRQFICRPYMIHKLRKYRKLRPAAYVCACLADGRPAFQPTPKPLPATVIRTCMTTDLQRLTFTFWWSNPNTVIILDYKWNTKLILLPNVLPVYHEMALKCCYFALITHMITWPWRIAACWN